MYSILLFFIKFNINKCMHYQSQRQQKAVLPHNIKTIRQDEILSNSHKTKIIFTDLKASVYNSRILL